MSMLQDIQIIIYSSVAKYKYQIINSNMSLNDNGFQVQPVNYTSNINYITEGAVVGITIGWIVGIIGFYILGMLLIRYYFKKFPEDRSQSGPRLRKPSSSSDEQKNKRIEQRDNGESQQQKNQRRKRKLYQQNPTIEMINPTYYEEDTHNKISKGHRKHPLDINLNLEQKIQE